MNKKREAIGGIVIVCTMLIALAFASAFIVAGVWIHAAHGDGDRSDIPVVVYMLGVASVVVLVNPTVLVHHVLIVRHHNRQMSQ